MVDHEVTTEEWRILYGEADAFKRRRCWEWMNDGQLFGIVDPGTALPGYCCILGAAAEVYALVVYRGPEGLDIYRKIQAGVIGPEDDEANFGQNALIASFEPRESLEALDRALIRSLGLKYRGANDWPLFRSHLPGYGSWQLTREEAAFLTHALRQAVAVADRIKDDPHLLEPPEGDRILMRIPEAKDGKIVWSQQWRTGPKVDRATVNLPPVPKERLEAIRGTARESGTDWEIDFFFTPAPVQEVKGQRPFFPRAYCCMDRKSGMALDMQMAGDGVDHRTHFRGAWLKLVERTRSMPRRIFVKRSEVYDVFQPPAEELGIGIAIDENPMAVDDFRRELHRHFRGK